MKIPLMDLKAQYQSIRQELDPVVQKTFENAAFIGGPEKEAFEKEFAEACGVPFCLGVGNGTDSLMLALKAAGIGPGDEVLVPANSFIATSEMVTAAGGTNVFVDINEHDFLMNLDLAEELLKSGSWKRGGRIKAIIPVHLYGRVVNMERVMALAKEHDLFVLEDAAQAHLGQWNGQKVGSMGHVGSFSFYPGKNLGAAGDGGALTTKDPALFEKMKKLANHGRIGKYDHDMEGFNSRLDGLQAAVLRVKLRHLPRWTDERRSKASIYRRLLSENPIPGLILPEETPAENHVYHLFVVRLPHRDTVHGILKEQGIETVIHYPTALPLLKAYQHMKLTAADFPVASKLQTEILSLPLYPEMSLEQQQTVVKALREACTVAGGK